MKKTLREQRLKGSGVRKYIRTMVVQDVHRVKKKRQAEQVKKKILSPWPVT
jgi:hypothetical protein